MNKRRFMENNKGYSLIELIIVIAITALLTAAAYVTLSVMHSAKAKEASTTFESELNELSNKARGQMCVVSDVEKPTYKFCLKLYTINGKPYIKQGYYKGAELAFDSESSYTFIDSENVGSGKGISLSSYVDVSYTPFGGTETLIGEGSEELECVYIVFDKNGNCLNGSGEFSFRRKNGNMIATVTLNKNGSHQQN